MILHLNRATHLLAILFLVVAAGCTSTRPRGVDYVPTRSAAVVVDTPPLQVFVPPPSRPEVVCATNGRGTNRSVGTTWQTGWAYCHVEPLDGYNDPSKLRLASSWVGQTCVDGLAHGDGTARWCPADADCLSTTTDLSIVRATGTAAHGLFIAECPMRVVDRYFIFDGMLNESQALQRGRLVKRNDARQVVSTFVGTFKSGRRLDAGSLKIGSYTYITDSFSDSGFPNGPTLVVADNGPSFVGNCRGMMPNCTVIETSLRLSPSEHQLMRKAFEDAFISEVEKQLIRNLLTRIFPRLALPPWSVVLAIIFEVANVL